MFNGFYSLIIELILELSWIITLIPKTGDCIKESQRKGFCSRHLTDNKRSDTKRVSRPPSTTEPPQNNQSGSSGQGGQPSIHCTAQEVEAASILISLKNTPSRSATPHQEWFQIILGILLLLTYIGSIYWINIINNETIKGYILLSIAIANKPRSVTCRPTNWSNAQLVKYAKSKQFWSVKFDHAGSAKSK